MPPGAGLDAYREVWLVDFEFSQPPGERPTPVCLVAREFRSGRTIRLWQDDLERISAPPYPTGPDSLFVAYFASAELSCHLSLGWPLPERVLDLYVEFRNRTNGLPTPSGAGLLGALAWYGLPALEAVEKTAMRDLVIRGGPWSASEREAILDYCESDVIALARLLPAMAPDLDIPRALPRGRYMGAVARMEAVGVPIDVETLGRLRAGWDAIKDRLIGDIDSRFHVYDGRSFRADRWAGWLARNGIAWPTLDTGALALDDDTFREVARSHPDVAIMRELRYALSQLRLSELAVGSDGRNRAMLSPFRARTGRNQPSNSQFIFGPSCWLRGLIRPEPGMALAYVDWSQQEFGIAAALSGDARMQAAYLSGDPYLEFGKQAGRIPADGTKKTHAADREMFKACVLGVQYGMGGESLARRIGQPAVAGRDLLRLHRETYPAFWRWSDSAEHHAMLLGRLQTVFGWTVRVGTDANPRSLRNFPCQANGAEMLRWAISGSQARGVSVVAPVHDAILIEAPASRIQEAVAEAQEAMAEASSAVLDGFRLRSDAKIVISPDVNSVSTEAERNSRLRSDAEMIAAPDRYMDDRGRAFWDRVMSILPPTEGR